MSSFSLTKGDYGHFKDLATDAEMMFEGEVVSSTHIASLDNDTYTKLENTKKPFDKSKHPEGGVFDGAGELSRYELWMDLVQVTKVYKGALEIGSQYPIFYRKYDKKVAKEMGVSHEIDRTISQSLKGDILKKPLFFIVDLGKKGKPVREICLNVCDAKYVEKEAMQNMVNKWIKQKKP